MIQIGDRFSLAEENIFGVVTDRFFDGYGELASVVVEMDDGQWAAVDMSLVVPRTLQ